MVRLASDEAFRDSLGRQAKTGIMERLNNDGVSRRIIESGQSPKQSNFKKH